MCPASQSDPMGVVNHPRNRQLVVAAPSELYTQGVNLTDMPILAGMLLHMKLSKEMQCR